MIEITKPCSAVEAQRLFHGRGKCFEGMEHIAIDCFPSVVLITLYREDLPFLKWASDQLMEQIPFEVSAILVQHRWMPKAPMELLKGRLIQKHIVVEDGLKYHLDFFKDQNIGFFLDMKWGRQWVRELATGKRVLNLFAYTCSFSVAASAAGARQVVNVDLSRAALTQGRENHRLNGQELGSISFAKLNILKSFGKISRLGPFDLVIIDPPSYQKDSFDVSKDYRKIVRRLKDFVSSNAKVLACLNSVYHDLAFLKEIFESEFPGSHFVEMKSAPCEFPEKEKSRALKICLFELTQ